MTRGIDWLLDPRQLPVRLLVLLTAAVGCLLLLTDAPTVTDWIIAMTAVLVTARSARLPLTTALAAIGVLILGFTVGDTGPVVPKVAAALAVAELATRRGGLPPVLGGFALAAAYLFHTAGGPGATVYRAIVMALLPVLLGARCCAQRGRAPPEPATMRPNWHAGAKRRSSRRAPPSGPRSRESYTI